MGIRRLVLTLASLSSVCTIGCGFDSDSDGSPVESGRFATADLDAHISVSASEPGEILVQASLEHDTDFDDDHVVLSDGDSFRATAPDGQTRTLKRSKSSAGPRYRARFETTPAEGLVRVRFRDSNLDVRLRPEFSVTSPTPGAVLGIQDDLHVEWTPAEPGHAMVIRIRVSCATTTGGTRGGGFSNQISDTGAYAYDLSLLPQATDPTIDTSKDCSLEVELQRESSALISPPFEATHEMGSTQTRSVQGLLITF